MAAPSNRSLCTTLLLLAFLPLLVKAHIGGLAQTVPDHDAVLERAPTQLHFQFMANVTITNIKLEFASGNRMGERLRVIIPRNSIGQSTAYGEQIALELPPLEPATYTVTWQAMSLDGYIIVDDFNFTVASQE